jgi:hypothetical protein
VIIAGAPLSKIFDTHLTMQVTQKIEKNFPDWKQRLGAAGSSGMAAPTSTTKSLSDSQRMQRWNKSMVQVLKQKLAQNDGDYGSMSEIVVQARDLAFPHDLVTHLAVTRTGWWRDRRTVTEGEEVVCGVEFVHDFARQITINVGDVFKVFVYEERPGMETGCTMEEATRTAELFQVFGFLGEDPVGLWITSQDNASSSLRIALSNNGKTSGTMCSMYQFKECQQREQSFRSPQWVFDPTHHLQQHIVDTARGAAVTIGLLGTHLQKVPTRFFFVRVDVINNNTYEKRNSNISSSNTEVMLPYTVCDYTGVITPVKPSSWQLLLQASSHLHGIDVTGSMIFAMTAPIIDWWSEHVMSQQECFTRIQPCVLKGVPFPLVANIAMDSVCSCSVFDKATRVWTISFDTISDLASALEITLRDNQRSTPLKFLRHCATMVYCHELPGVVTITIGRASSVLTSPRRGG